MGCTFLCFYDVAGFHNCFLRNFQCVELLSGHLISEFKPIGIILNQEQGWSERNPWRLFIPVWASTHESLKFFRSNAFFFILRLPVDGDCQSLESPAVNSDCKPLCQIIQIFCFMLHLQLHLNTAFFNEGSKSFNALGIPQPVWAWTHESYIFSGQNRSFILNQPSITTSSRWWLPITRIICSQ